MIVKLLTEQHLEFLAAEACPSLQVKMPHCWKSHAMAQINLSYQDSIK